MVAIWATHAWRNGHEHETQSVLTLNNEDCAFKTLGWALFCSQTFLFTDNGVGLCHKFCMTCWGLEDSGLTYSCLGKKTALLTTGYFLHVIFTVQQITEWKMIQINTHPEARQRASQTPSFRFSASFSAPRTLQRV